MPDYIYMKECVMNYNCAKRMIKDICILTKNCTTSTSTLIYKTLLT